jgi:hypothetical protein
MVIGPSAVKGHIKKNRKEGIVVGILMLLLFVSYFFISTPGGTLKIDEYKFFWQ